ncbi:hypothetical protein QTO34_005602 [Cnephaeus nilssonii]|uniref:Caspase activity and apoptosis inhibitor 1 n=1 Tax=Cnephaeus nilssonii TaxID=3371016 RepID=A0AA40HPH7_CNENI|nr:hypothetical protein QTO34_005602 [Eptesicus nilssonii]
MTGKKSSREKRRKRSGQEAAAALATPDLRRGRRRRRRLERGERRKRRSTDSSSGVSGSVPQEAKYLLPTLEKELFLAEHSDLEEGGLDLTVSLKPVSFYISDKKEMLQQCFCIVGEKKLQKMLPDVLKNCSVEEIKKLCQEQLELLSEKKILKILEGDNGMDSDMEEEADDGSKKGSDLVSQQDICIDSSSSLKENKQPEGLELKQGMDQRYLVLYSNIDKFTSHQEGSCRRNTSNIKIMVYIQIVAIKFTIGEYGEWKRGMAKLCDEREAKLSFCVDIILTLVEELPKGPKAATLTVPPPEDVQPSAQQLELLELEMRARAIKALMKAGDIKKQA